MKQNREQYLFWQQELRIVNFAYVGYGSDTERESLGVELADGKHLIISYHFETKELYLLRRQAKRLESTARQFVLNLSKYAGIVYLGNTNWKDRPHEPIDELAKLTEMLKQRACSSQEILDDLLGSIFNPVWLAAFNKEILNHHPCAPLFLEMVKEIEKEEENWIQIEEIEDIFLVSMHPQNDWIPVFWWRSED
jgi:hypothetical protein